MNLQVVQQHLDNVLLFTVDVQLVSGRRRVRSEDIVEAKGIVLEEDDVMTLGSKKVFDPEKLRAFERLKDRMHRECMKRGAPFLSGYAVPESRADDLAGALDKIVGEANVELASLLKNFQQTLDDYCAARPEWAQTIRANSYSEAYVRQRVAFGFNAVKVSAGRGDGVIASNLSGQVSGLLGNLLRGVADDAEQLQEKSLAGKDKKTRKVLRPLKAAREKLQGFAFLDRRVSALAEMIESVEMAMPADGPIEGADLALLWGITTILSNPQKALKVAEQFQADGKDCFMASLVPRPTAVVSTPASNPALVPTAPVPPAMPAMVALGHAVPGFPTLPKRDERGAAPAVVIPAVAPAAARGFGALAGFRR
jgi:hypothetical protein